MNRQFLGLASALVFAAGCNQAPAPVQQTAPAAQTAPAPGTDVTAPAAGAAATTTSAPAATEAPAGSMQMAAPAAGGATPPTAGAAPAPAATAAPAATMAPAAASAAPAATGMAAAASAAAPAAPAKQMMMEMTVPAGTPLEVTLQTSVSSATSKVEDVVRGKVTKAVAVDGMTTIPAGAEVSGTVIEANPSGRVKGRASFAIRFNRVTVEKTAYDIRTARISRMAEATKTEDAKKVGIGAGAGALIGAIAGGKKGAAIGGVVGGGAGAGVVASTKGEEVSLGAGAVVKTTIESPVKINALM